MFYCERPELFVLLCSVNSRPNKRFFGPAVSLLNNRAQFHKNTLLFYTGFIHSVIHSFKQCAFYGLFLCCCADERGDLFMFICEWSWAVSWNVAITHQLQDFAGVCWFYCSLACLLRVLRRKWCNYTDSFWAGRRLSGCNQGSGWASGVDVGVNRDESVQGFSPLGYLMGAYFYPKSHPADGGERQLWRPVWNGNVGDSARNGTDGGGSSVFFKGRWLDRAHWTLS